MNHTESILQHFNAADSDTVAAGTDWYPRAHREAARISRATGIPVRRAAAVIAALSPRCQWSVNVTWAEQVCAAAAAGDSTPPAVHTQVFRELAWNIATGELPPRAMSDLRTRGVGPKVARFFRNIVGDLEAVTVDVWAARAAGIPHADVARPSGYDPVEASYQAAAQSAGVPPATLQAIVWIQVRGRAA